MGGNGNKHLTFYRLATIEINSAAALVVNIARSRVNDSKMPRDLIEISEAEIPKGNARQEAPI